MESTREGDGRQGWRGVLAALAVLLVVLGAAGMGYSYLAGQPESAGSVTDAARAGAASGSGSSADLPRLADYDSTVLSEYGDATTLTKIADGRPLVVNFWATWCPYCIDEMGDFQELYDEYGDRVSFAFVDATDGTRETIEDARAWIEANDYTLPFYYDVRREAVPAYGVQAFPTTVVVSADGDILTISPGRIDPALMRSSLDSLLQEAAG